MADPDKALEEIVGFSLAIDQELRVILKEKYGISETVSKVLKGRIDRRSSKPEQSQYEIILSSSPNNKINVIKEVRLITGLGLKAAKDLVESNQPVLVIANSRDDALKLKDRLFQAGASIEVPGLDAENEEETDDSAVWAAADWLSLGEEAKRVSLSLDNTLSYVQAICNNINKVQSR